MTGAQRRRRKEQRRLAKLVVHDPRGFTAEINSRVLELHRYAAERARTLRTTNGDRMPLSAELSTRAQAIEADIRAALEILEQVFVTRSADPRILDFSVADVHNRRGHVMATVRELDRGVARVDLSSEIADTAARALAQAAEEPFHRLVWGGYLRGRGTASHTEVA